MNPAAISASRFPPKAGIKPTPRSYHPVRGGHPVLPPAGRYRTSKASFPRRQAAVNFDCRRLEPRDIRASVPAEAGHRPSPAADPRHPASWPDHRGHGSPSANYSVARAPAYIPAGPEISRAELAISRVDKTAAFSGPLDQGEMGGRKHHPAEMSGQRGSRGLGNPIEFSRPAGPDFDRRFLPPILGVKRPNSTAPRSGSARSIPDPWPLESFSTR